MAAGEEKEDESQLADRLTPDEHDGNHKTSGSNGGSVDDAEQQTHHGPEEQAGNGDADEEEEDDDDEEDGEPKLKYTKLTGSLATVYRNGDATSASLLAGDKMVIGTHNGNIHVFSLPTVQSLRMYHAHSASITAVSVSPIPPPPQLQITRQETNGRFAVGGARPLSRAPSSQTIKPSPTSASASSRAKQSAVPPTSSNQIYIATSSIDGHVCVSSLIDPKDVTLRNFSRPVNAVALSPEYKTDRTYLSGGLAGSLILTVGGKAGVSADANTSTTAAAAGWFGFGQASGKDTLLHSGEGTISTIKFSTTGTFVAWVNEHGIKIMRSHLNLDSADADHAWKRIGHVDRPNRPVWEDMASVWKPRIQWIDDRHVEADDDVAVAPNGGAVDDLNPALPPKKKRRPEKLVVGWGDTTWLIHVRVGALPKNGATRLPGKADIIHKLTFDDCVVSGLSLYTPTLLAVLSYRTKDDDDKPIPSGYQGRHKRQAGLQPELRLINAESGEEIDVDTLTISRYETLSAADYQLETMYIPLPPQVPSNQKGAFESVGAGIWEATANATRLLSSNASILSLPTTDRSSTKSPSGSLSNARLPTPRKVANANPFLSSMGLKIMIFSPYDCVLAIKRDLTDHLSWLMEHQHYDRAWALVDEHPSIVTLSDDRLSLPSSPSTPSVAAKGSLADFFGDDTSSQATVSNKLQDSAVQSEKQRIGDMWVQQLVAKEDWAKAGKVAGKVLGESSRWEHWVLAFAQSNHFDEITPYIPSTNMKPALPSFVYEVVLGHYIAHDPPRFRELLDSWNPGLFDVSSVKTAVENKLESGSVSEESEEGGEQGRDWRVLLDALAKLLLADGRPRDALHCYIRLQNADAAMSLISEYHLGDAISDDIPGLLMLRVSREQIRESSIEDLEESSSEVVRLLVGEAYQGVVSPEAVVSQLEGRDSSYRPFIYFYFRSLWQGRASIATQKPMLSRAERRRQDQQVEVGRLIVEEYGDLAVDLFAAYDRTLLMEFLRSTTAYTYERASTICEQKHYIPELVYVLSKTGQTKRALFLIIGELGDVSRAISFTKENPDLWDDLLDYSMDKPAFIRALLEEVGTAINPITLVRRIPDGLEIEGLRDGIGKMIREYEIQYSISDGVAKVLRGEVAAGMDALRAGQKKAIKFDIEHDFDGSEEEAGSGGAGGQVEMYVEDAGDPESSHPHELEEEKTRKEALKPGHCVGCKDAFDEDEKETLVGFSCGHVYHLSCLLDATDGVDQALIETLQQGQSHHPTNNRLSAPENDLDDGTTQQPQQAQQQQTRSVKAKVQHAQRIKQALNSNRQNRGAARREEEDADAGGGCVFCSSRLVDEGAN
ncbi:hypothetical protein AAFC00_005872 [Neodothiora populina]|uniref:Vacuolar assembly protein n=1 Tax=Neodothiora populina TaxID=2781224 RepID=A0ABR3P653_9PEZI